MANLVKQKQYPGVTLKQSLAKWVSPSIRPFKVMEPQGDRAIVIPWLSTGEQWEELKYTLRSIHVHFEDKECPIYIIGDAPPKWMKAGDRLQFIKIGQYAQSKDAGLFQARVVGLQIAEKVAWWNDDIYLLQPVSWKTLEVALTEGILDDVENELRLSTNGFRRSLGNCSAELRARGISPVMRFATHTPFLFEAEKSREILRSFYISFAGGFVSLYHNWHKTPHKPCLPYKTEKLPANGQLYLNHPSQGPDDQTKKLLKEMFPHPAPWELS